MSSLLFYTHKDLSVYCSHLLFHVFYVAVSYCDREKEERERKEKEMTSVRTHRRASSPPLSLPFPL